MEYELSREQPAKGLSYPIGRSELDDVLTAAGVASLSEVDMRMPSTLELRREDPLYALLRVDYDGEETYRRWKAPGWTTLVFYAVPSRVKAAIAGALRTGALMDMAGWIAAIPEQTETWRMVDHHYQLGADLDRPERLITRQG